MVENKAPFIQYEWFNLNQKVTTEQGETEGVYAMTHEPVPCYMLNVRLVHQVADPDASPCTSHYQVVFDCPLDYVYTRESIQLLQSTILHSHPSLLFRCFENIKEHVEWDRMKAICLSNPYSFLALPFLTEYVYSNYSDWVLFATEPVVELARILMMECVESIKNLQVEMDTCPNHTLDTRVLIDGQLYPFYTESDIDHCLSRITLVHYNEKKYLERGLSVTALSAGYGLGACQWAIDYHGSKLCYMSYASVDPHLRHAAPLDHSRLLKDADCMVFSHVLLSKEQESRMVLERIASTTARRVEQQGHVVICCDILDSLYDLLASVQRQLQHVGLGHIPLHVVSSMAKTSLHLSNIYGEWMSKEYQTSLYEPKKPLLHGSLIANKQLFVHSDVFDVITGYQGPLILFMPHPCLYMDPIHSFLQDAELSKKFHFIFTDPRFNTQSILEQRHVHIDHTILPLESRLDVIEVTHILSSLTPKTVHVPFEAFKSLHPLVPSRVGIHVSPLPSLVAQQHDTTIVDLDKAVGYEAYLEEEVKVAVLGAAGGIGQPLSLLLKANPLVTELALYDIVNTPGVAADLSHINTPAQVAGYVGNDQLEKALTGAAIIVIPAGVPRKPGMTRDDLFKINAGIVKTLATAAAKFAPKAFICVISNPVNSTVPIVAEVFKEAGVFDPKRLFGVTTLDIVRASTFVTQAKGGDPQTLNVPVIGGHSGVTIIPILSATGITFTQEQVDQLTHRIQYGGDEVVKAKDGAGSATLSMAFAGARFVQSLLDAFVLKKKNVTECTFVKCDLVGGLDYFSAIVEFGVEGVEKIHPLPALNEHEKKLLDAAIPELKANITKGVEFTKAAAP